MDLSANSPEDALKRANVYCLSIDTFTGSNAPWTELEKTGVRLIDGDISIITGLNRLSR